VRTLPRAVLAVSWGVAWALEATGRAMTYATAGVLTREELRTGIARGWERYGADESFIVSGLQIWEQEVYDRTLRPADRILVVGCGTGRDLVALLRRGHDVEGLEPARRPLDIARQTLDKLGLRARLHHGAIESADLRGPYDVVVFSPYCYSYIPESRSRVAILEKMKRVLAPGGRIIVPYLPAEQRRTLPIQLTRAVARLARSDWRPEPGDKVWIAHLDGWVVQFNHEFEPSELEAEVGAAGLHVVFHRRHGPGSALGVLTA
jgi:SAM-dependent methyltransferase